MAVNRAYSWCYLQSRERTICTDKRFSPLGVARRSRRAMKGPGSGYRSLTLIRNR